MKAVFLVSHSPNCETFWRSWTCIGNTCHVERYDVYPHDRQGELVELVKANNPDVVVYVGAVEQYYNRPVPTVETLKRIHDLFPSIMFCCDAGDDYWWNWLTLYDREQCFSAQVSIDGNFNTPLVEFSNGIVKLAPTDPSLFVPLPWDRRTTFFGMAGSDGGHAERVDFINGLGGQLDRRHGMSLEEMGRFLGSCKIVANHPVMGTGRGVHVKARVLEAGWAGACCLEKVNPITSVWFPDDMLLYYYDTASALQKLAWARDNDDGLRHTAERFHQFVKANHSPHRFWYDVLAKAVKSDARLNHYPVDLPA